MNLFAAKLSSNKPICASLSSRLYHVLSDGAIVTWLSHAALYLAIRQVSVARDITELLIGKLANAALQLEACEGASHTPEPDMPCPCSKRIRGISLKLWHEPMQDTAEQAMQGASMLKACCAQAKAPDACNSAASAFGMHLGLETQVAGCW